ncbi:MAG: iron-sulfur cluster assembly scaffold protein [Lentisphaeria bacterium]|nr:iron-sulfur cluster assembly scaffold protein [Lentisphaeria bacterium]
MDEDVTTQKRSAHFGALNNADGRARITGPCGDTMEFWLAVDAGGRVTKVGFTTDGCGSSVICGEAACRIAEGALIKVVRRLEQADVLALARGVPDEHRHCALLAANTLKQAVRSVRGT